MIRFLLVEDDERFAAKCAEVLIRQSFQVEYCGSAERAKILIIDKEFDFAIIDLMLPPDFGFEGIELLRFLRDRQPSTQVIMMTSRQTGMTELAASAIQIGAHFFLDKEAPDFNDKMLRNIKEMMMENQQSVFVSHGHDELMKLKLKNFIQNRMARPVVILAEQPSHGLTIVEKLERASEKCNFAVILLTKDDEQKDGAQRARQNVIHEVGFFQGKYGRKNVVLLCERGVELFSNISGIVRIDFESSQFESVFEPLRIELETTG